MDSALDDASFVAGWLKLRDELAARIAARFDVASAPGSDFPDPDVLADLALERALLS